MKLFSLVAAVAVIAIACSDSTSNEELNATSDFQSAILEDDEVTSGEMEFAVASYVDCLGELGVTTEGSFGSVARRVYLQVYKRCGQRRRSS